MKRLIVVALVFATALLGAAYWGTDAVASPRYATEAQVLASFEQHGIAFPDGSRSPLARAGFCHGSGPFRGSYARPSFATFDCLVVVPNGRIATAWYDLTVRLTPTGARITVNGRN